MEAVILKGIYNSLNRSNPKHEGSGVKQTYTIALLIDFFLLNFLFRLVVCLLSSCFLFRRSELSFGWNIKLHACTRSKPFQSS